MSQTNIPNFHTHTVRCNHAVGNPVDYFEQAMSDGCSALGFSDHCPYPDGDVDFLWPHVRMLTSEISDYMRDVRELRKKSDFPIFVGFECEWDKNFEWWYREKLLGEYGADYLVLGPHWVTKGREHIPAVNIDDSGDLHKYIDQMIEAMNSGLYAFVAHPDLFMSKREVWDDDIFACFDAIIDAAEDLQLPLEVNGLGLMRKPKHTQAGERYQYPHDEFWERVAGRNVQVICNADAHDPKYVISSAKNARNYAARYDLNIIDGLNFVLSK